MSSFCFRRQYPVLFEKVFRVFFSSAKWFGTEFRVFSVPRIQGKIPTEQPSVPSCSLFCRIIFLSENSNPTYTYLVTKCRDIFKLNSSWFQACKMLHQYLLNPCLELFTFLVKSHFLKQNFRRRRIFSGFKSSFLKGPRFTSHNFRVGYEEGILRKIISKPPFCRRKWSPSAKYIASTNFALEKNALRIMLQH